MKVSRYSTSGSTHRNGIGAMFCVRWLVTASSRTDAQHASAPHIRYSDQGSAGAPALPWSLYLMWGALACCASVLLLAVTSHLTQNIAPIPFLWVLPLVLYLLTFILCFEGHGWYRRDVFLSLLFLGIAGICSILLSGTNNPSIWVLIGLYSSTLFFACMVCHGELAALKPHPRSLTAFYVMLSVGGALGGVF